jgi:hypothetical protein
VTEKEKKKKEEDELTLYKWDQTGWLQTYKEIAQMMQYSRVLQIQTYIKEHDTNNQDTISTFESHAANCMVHNRIGCGEMRETLN